MTAADLRQHAKTILTDRQYEIWKLTHLNNCSQRTIALMLDIDRSTVRTTLTRANQKLDRAIRYPAADADVPTTPLRKGQDGSRTSTGPTESTRGEHRAVA